MLYVVCVCARRCVYTGRSRGNRPVATTDPAHFLSTKTHHLSSDGCGLIVKHVVYVCVCVCVYTLSHVHIYTHTVRTRVHVVRIEWGHCCQFGRAEVSVIEKGLVSFGFI